MKDRDIDWAEVGRRSFLKQPMESLPVRRHNRYIAYVAAFILIGLVASALWRLFGG